MLSWMYISRHQLDRRVSSVTNGKMKQYMHNPTAAMTIILGYISSDKSHWTVGFERKYGTPLANLQSNADSAASILPWKVKTKIDSALERSNRNRLEERINSVSISSSKIQRLIFFQSSGRSDVFFILLCAFKCCWSTVLRRLLWLNTEVLERSASWGFNAFHSAPSVSIFRLLNLRHNDDVSKHMNTDLNFLGNDQSKIVENLKSCSCCDIMRHLKTTYRKARQIMKSDAVTGPINTKMSLVWGE